MHAHCIFIMVNMFVVETNFFGFQQHTFVSIVWVGGQEMAVPLLERSMEQSHQQKRGPTNLTCFV